MSGMDQFLAEYYGTGGGVAEATDDGMGKQAQVELFAKMAAAEGIDLNQLTDAQVETLYNNTFSKEASDDKDEDDKDGGEKKEKAKEEHEEKKAQQEKLGEADFLGRVMAHAYVQELNKIAEATDDGSTKEALSLPKGSHLKQMYHSGKKSVKKSVGDAADYVSEHASAGAKRYKELLSGSKRDTHAARSAQANKISDNLSGDSMSSRVNKALAKDKGTREGAAAAEEGKKVFRTRAATGAAGAAAAGGAGYAATRDKKASAIDELAAELAIEKAAAAGWDGEEAGERVAAVMILGPSEDGSKVAMASDVDGAIDIRSSEILEQAGYPVNWD